MECFIAVPASDEKTFPHGLPRGGIFDGLVLLCTAVKWLDPGHFGQSDQRPSNACSLFV